MKPGNLIRLKRQYASGRDSKAMFLILSQNSCEEQKLYGAYFKLLDKHSTIINLPLSSIFAYEVVQ